MLVLVACGNDPSVAPPGISFPTYDAGGPHPLALLDGTLEVHEGCVYIRAGHGGRFVGLWPRGYRSQRVDGGIQIIDELGGFAALESWFEGIGGTALPRRCGHLFWQVSGIEPS
jgi:hypothetical protein